MIKYFKNKKIYRSAKTFQISAPKENAFKYHIEISKEILCIIKENNIKKENLVILISLGPAAKVIAYKLSKLGFLVYDMGYFFKFFSL